jgi:hypothetical protein
MSPGLLDDLRSRMGNRRRPDQIDSFFDDYGLLGNPFPPARIIIPEVIHNQQSAKEGVAQAIIEVMEQAPGRRALGIVGGTGVGKTHFLRHTQYAFQALCRDTDKKFIIVETQAGSAGIMDLVKLTYEQADLLCRESRQLDFLSTIVNNLSDSSGNEILEGLHSDELRRAITTTLEQAREENTFDLFPFNIERLTRLTEPLRRWLVGSSMNATECRRLGVYSRINTSSVAVKMLSEMLTLACRMNIIHGMLLCVDEVESLFARDLSKAKIQAYVQDLRFLHDESMKENVGYSLLMLSAATELGANRLADVNFAVFQRLGFDDSLRVKLNPISKFTEARDLAKAYLEYGQNKWKDEYPKKKAKRNTYDLIAEDEIEKIFAELSKSAKKEGAELVSQASLLQAFHKKVEEERS